MVAGVQDKFSWSGVALGAVSAGVTGGLGAGVGVDVGTAQFADGGAGCFGRNAVINTLPHRLQ